MLLVFQCNFFVEEGKHKVTVVVVDSVLKGVNIVDQDLFLEFGDKFRTVLCKFSFQFLVKEFGCSEINLYAHLFLLVVWVDKLSLSDEFRRTLELLCWQERHSQLLGDLALVAVDTLA